MQPTISVIIAAYNEAAHIQECIATLFSQTLEPEEIIVVDDGSIDDTWEILNKLKRKLKLQIYRLSHGEQAAARNFGVTKSTGEILVFPDADYYFDKRFLEKLVDPIVKKQAVATFTRAEYIANTENIWSQFWNMDRLLPSGKRMRADTPSQGNAFRAITREVFLKAQGFSETGYTCDVTVLNKLGLYKSSLAADGAICYHYNPDTLVKVFVGSKRLGSKGGVPFRLKSFIVYSLPNSIIKGIVQFFRGNLLYLPFKIVFDAGCTVGLWQRAIEMYLLKNLATKIYGQQQ